MTQEDQAAPVDEQEAPPESEEQAGSESGDTTPQPTEREKELERRLRAQGQQLADVRRTNNQLSSELTRINTTVTLIGEGLTAQQRQDDVRRQRETQAYLDSLPEPQRLKEEVRLANERVARMEKLLSTRNDAAARTSVDAPNQAQEETPQQYFRRRGNEIIAEAAETHGVTITREHLESLNEGDWDDERAFARAINRLAVKLEDGEEIMPNKSKAPAKAETPAEMEARITENVKRTLGVGSPTGPKPSGSVRRGAAPTVEDVAAAASTYDSRRGPKGNVAKLRELREKMG